MSSYRTKRRTFLAGIGGAFGLEVLLGNLEASAEGARPPPRLLVVHWPLGTLRERFLPQRVKQHAGEIALTKVRQHGHNQFARALRSCGDFECRRHRRAGTDADKQSFFLGQTPRNLHRFVV